MSASRRRILALGGGLGAALLLPRRPLAASVEVIEMRGTARGERIWFAPLGLVIPPGTTLRFVNKDPGNSHTATAYHPANFDRSRRIPSAAQAWDSDFLLPDESFDVTLSAPGVYDYYCVPHEHAGMAGRIVVGTPQDPDFEGAAPADEDLPPEVAATLPSVEAILASGRIEGEDR
ncbi:plastocyanin/azurin family copper-binding protein [Halovulum sp. GXIMD14794]